MRKHYSYLLLTTIILLSGKLSFAQVGGTHGRESGKSTINFTDLANYYKLHPTPLVRKRAFDEENEDRPARGPVDPSKIFLYHPAGSSMRSGSRTAVPLLPVSTAPADTFEASKSDGTSIPPDTHGAVDTNYVVEMINDSFCIQTRAGVKLPSMSLDNFWASVEPYGSTGANGGAFDPRIHYDPLSQRWITAVLAYGASNQSQMMIGASVTSDPTGAWHLYYIVIDPTGTNWLDFENVGFNKNWIVIGGNPFGIASGSSVGATVYVFNKDSVLSGIGAPYTSFNESTSFTICPAITYDTAESSLYMLENWNGAAGQLQLWKVSGPVNAPTLTSIGFPATSLFWQFEANANSGTAGADFVPQLGSTRKLQANDDRINNCVERNGKLWCAHNAFLPFSTTANATRCSAMWWQVDTSGTVNQNGVIDDPTNTNFYIFPSIAVNKNNDALIGFTTSSTLIHPASAYAVHMATDPADSIRPTKIFRHGQTTYYQTFGGGRDRWGDYSSTCLDPKNDTDFWTIQETVPTTPANYYDTWWAYVKMCYSITAAPTSSVIPSACTGTAALFSVIPPAGSITSYTWTINGTGWTGTSTTSSNNITAGTGIATISVTANNACSISPMLTFTVSPSTGPAKPTIAAPTIPCGSTAASYTATSTGATSYTWTVLGTGWSGTSATNVLNATITTGTGTIIATATSSCGTSVPDTITSTVGVGSLPAAPTAGFTPSLVCAGTTATYSVGAVTGATSYTWTLSGAGWSGSSVTDTANLTAGTATGTISVTATNACGTSVPYVFSIVPTLIPGTPVITPPTIPCGTTSGVYTVISTSSTSYTWTVAGTGWSGSSATNTISVTLGTGTGTLTASGTNACGTSSVTTITSTAPTATPPTPTAGATSPTSPCSGTILTYSVNPSAGASTYNWTITGTGWSGASTTNSINLTVGTGVATISVNAANGCGTSAAYVFTVTSSPSVLPTPVITVPVLPCGGATTATFYAGSIGATVYNWTILGTGWSGSSTTSSIVANVGIGTGTVICSASNPCASSAPDTITVTPAASIPSSSASIILPTPICSDNYEVFSTPVVPTASSYQWTVSGVGWSGSSITNVITLAVGTGAATITVNGVNGCGSAAPYSTVVIPILTPMSAFSIQHHTTVLSANDTITYTGTYYLTTAFAWGFSGGFATPGTGIGPQSVHWLSTGLKTITLNVSDSGCSSNYTDTVLVLNSLNVNELSSKNANFNVIPNPNNGAFEIEFNDAINKDFEVRMMDMTGRVVYNNHFTGMNSKAVNVQTQGLASGTYIITVIIDKEVAARTITIRK